MTRNPFNIDTLRLLPHDQRVFTALEEFFPSGVGSFYDSRIQLGGGDSIRLTDAATGVETVTYADGGTEAADALLVAASEGAEIWSRTSPFERAKVLRNVARHISDHVEELALLETVTTGKPIRDTRVEAVNVAGMFDYYSGWADKIMGETIPVPGEWLTYTTRVPWGVAVSITPWNAPLTTAAWNCTPALATGNSVIMKPSEFTPFTTLRLAQLAEEAGLPRNVLTVAVGLGATIGAALTDDPRTNKISFVGSVPTGRNVGIAAARNGVSAVLELGGKSANIVFDDANLERAANGSLHAIFGNAGQACTAGSRLLVQRSAHDEFVALLLDRVKAIRVGDPLDPDTEIGPIITEPQIHTVRRLIEIGSTEGGTLLGSTKLPDHIADGDLSAGRWVMPTIIGDVASDSTLEQNEVFGPVMGIGIFDTEEEAVLRANNTTFGLAGAIWTQNVAKAHRVAQNVRSGTFWINAYKTIHVAVPFGGFGDSGHGRSSGPTAINEYLQTKSVWVPTSDTPAPFPSHR